MIDRQKFLQGITTLCIAFLILSFSVWNEVRIFNNYYRGDIGYERIIWKDEYGGSLEERISGIRETWIKNEMSKGLVGESLLGEGSPWTPGGEKTVRTYEFWSSIPMVIVRILLILLGCVMMIRGLQSLYQFADSPLTKRRVWKGVIAIGGVLLVLSFLAEYSVLCNHDYRSQKIYMESIRHSEWRAEEIISRFATPYQIWKDFKFDWVQLVMVLLWIGLLVWLLRAIYQNRKNVVKRCVVGLAVLGGLILLSLAVETLLYHRYSDPIALFDYYSEQSLNGYGGEIDWMTGIITKCSQARLADANSLLGIIVRILLPVTGAVLMIISHLKIRRLYREEIATLSNEEPHID